MSERDDELRRFLEDYERALEQVRALARSVTVHRELLVEPLLRAPFALPRVLRDAAGAAEVSETLRSLGRHADRLAVDRATRDAALRGTIQQVLGVGRMAGAEPDAAESGLRGGGGGGGGRGFPLPTAGGGPPPPKPGMPAPMAPGGGLLGVDDEPAGAPPSDAPAAPPPAAPPAPATPPDSRWINAELEDHDRAEPLRTGVTYTLAFGVDLARSESAVGSGAFGYVYQPGEQEATLTVQVDSEDFDVGEPTRPLRVPRTGPSRGKARFDITPRHDGAGTLTATFHKDGNFVQQMTVTLQVGTAAAATSAPVQATSLGRPIAAAAVLHPRDLGIAVSPAAGGGFDCTVWGAVSTRARLPIQPAELADAIEQLRAALMKVVTQRDAAHDFVFQQRIDIPDADRDQAIVTIARAGYRLYQKLFYHPAADTHANRVGDFLRAQATRDDTVLRLQVVAEGFPIPWSLLYLAEEWDETAVDWQRFLGMRHVVEQIPLQNTLSVPDGTIASDRPALAVSVNVNEGIDAQMRADFVARQQRYWDEAAQARPRLRVTRRTTRAEVVQALRSADTADQLLYLYCHAEAAGLGGAGGPDASCLVLSGNERLTLGDLNLDAPTRVALRGAPLVFINACESGELSPMFYDGFVPYFMAKGARGVVGTECKTPALFAAEWARRFFDRFLAGEPLGRVFLDLRREFYLQHGNPLGLMYGVHCDGDTQVEPALGVPGSAPGPAAGGTLAAPPSAAPVT